jgi:hypothetical protein
MHDLDIELHDHERLQDCVYLYEIARHGNNEDSMRLCEMTRHGKKSIDMTSRKAFHWQALISVRRVCHGNSIPHGVIRHKSTLHDNIPEDMRAEKVTDHCQLAWPRTRIRWGIQSYE